MDKKITRRSFLQLTGMAAAAAALAACTPATTVAPTVAPTAKPTDKPVEATEKPTDKPTDKPTEVPATEVPPTEVPPTEEPHGGTLIVGRGGDSVLLDLMGATDGESHRVANEIADRLVILADPDPNKIAPIPWLAEKYESADGKVWTFTIRDCKFHDDTVCDAEAVKFNFDRWTNPDNEWRFGLANEYYNTEFGGTNPMTEVKVVDAKTLQVTLTTPSAVMLYKLPIGAFGIHSPTAIKAQGDKYGTPAGTCVGTGPQKFVEWVPNDKITVVKNENFWNKGLPKLDGIIWRSIPDNAARLAAFIGGEVQQADLAQTDMATAAADPNIVEYTAVGLSVGYIGFQQAKPPFDSLDVRWAVAHAINRQAIMDAFYNPAKGDALAYCFQPPAILGSNPDVGPIEYSVDKAKERLAAAGLANGFKTEFWYIPVIRGYFPDSKAIAEAIAVDLAKVGIEVELKTQDWGAYLAARLEGEFPMWMLGWGSDNGDPDNFIGYHFAHAVGKPNKEDGYANDTLAQLIIDGAMEPDVTKREAIYKQCEQIVHDDMARLPFVWTAGLSYWHKSVKGIDPQPYYDLTNHIWIEK